MADIKRLNYFNGQFLKQEDFNDEQAYQIDMRRRLNRTLHTWGVADAGLLVSLVPGTTNQISVGAGMALDNQGREIVLLTPQTRNLSGEPANSDVYVTIQYQETKTDPPPNSTDTTLSTRWTEAPKVDIARTRPAADGAVIILAKVHLDGSSNVVAPIDQSVRTIASSKVGPMINLQGGSLTWGNSSQLKTDHGGSIELGGDPTTPGTGTPFIDFHFRGKTEDFNARIINDNDGMLTISAPITHTTGKLTIDDNVLFGSRPRQMLNLWSTEYGIGVQGGTQYYRTATNFAWFRGGTHHDTAFNPGTNGARMMALNAAGDLILSNRTNPTADPAKSMCRALVDNTNKLYINFANDFNQGTYVDSDLHVSGNITSPRFRVTQVYNNDNGPLVNKAAGRFTSGGGTLLIFASGSGFRSGTTGMIGMRIRIDGNEQGLVQSFTNEPGSHKSFVTNTLVSGFIAAGDHSVTLEALDGTVTDVNDRFDVTVLELPFQTGLIVTPFPLPPIPPVVVNPNL